MNLILLFGTLLVIFTLYWKYDELLRIRFVDSINSLQLTWRNFVNKVWVAYKSRDDTLYLDYGKDHENYAEIVQVPDMNSYVDKYL